MQECITVLKALQIFCKFDYTYFKMTINEENMLYVIAGATATGKTALAVELAKHINGEIISADSMQVYKYMNIGTAKPTEEEKQGIPHHLLDVISPDKSFSMAEYQKLGRIAINDICSRNKTPIIVGGTGFYINGLIFGAELSQNENNNNVEDELRQKFTTIANERGAGELHIMLQKVDPLSAEAIHPNNVKRVIRALSYNKSTGKLFSAHNTEQKTTSPLYDAKFFVLNMNRTLLYERINQRTITMWQAGLVDEVRKLLSMGYDSRLAPLQGIGYKEVFNYLNEESPKNKEGDTISAIQQSTRNYAKRQETWFRNKNPSAYLLKVEGKSADTLVRELLK